MKKRLIYLIAAFFLGVGLVNAIDAQDLYVQSVQNQTSVATKEVNCDVCEVSTLEVIAAPQNYLNKTVKFKVL